MLLGLVSSTFSTLVSQFTAALIGRDAPVDWMSVAAIPGRDWALGSDPSAVAVALGIAFHQWADFSWAVFFFAVLGPWTARLRPRTIMLVAVPWAVFTSACEWLVLVPLFPFWQPIFTLQQPYWIGFLVHLSSAVIYPLLPWLRGRTDGVADRSDRRFMVVWSAGCVLVLTILGSLALLAANDREIPWSGHDLAADQTYIRHMHTHHAQGIELAQLGAGRAGDPHLRALAQLMVASQRGENRIFENWWRRWFKLPMQICSAQERAAMPGLLRPDQLQQLQSAAPPQFDALFVNLMTEHHKGAVKMADAEWRSRGDVRLRIMAHAIRHEQQGEIALMQGVSGTDAVRLAMRNMTADNVNPPE